MPTTPLILPNRTRTLVQIAKTWPIDPGGWTQIDAWCQSAVLGLCNDVGSAQLYTPAGTIFKPGKSVSQAISSLNIGGQYVQVSQFDPAGSVTDSEDGTKYSPLWWGVISKRIVAPDANQVAFFNSYKCSGIMSVLDSVVPPWHFTTTQAPSTTASDCGAAPIFNKLGTKISGNMSPNLYDFGGGWMAPVFDFSGDAVMWTALDVVKYYLGLYILFGGGGPRFDLGGLALTGALGFSEQWDLSGHSCGEALSRVMSQKQGVGYRWEMNGFQPRIIVESFSPTPVTVPAVPPFTAAYTLPANYEQITIDLTDPDHIQKFNITEDSAATVDQMFVQISPTWYAVTFSLFDDFIQDWTPADQTAYEAQSDGDNTFGSLNTNTGIARVWRRWKINPAWNGIFTGGFVLPNTHNFASSALYGSSGLDGTSSDDAVTVVSPNVLEMTGELPCIDGYDWATQDPAAADKTRRNAPIQAFAQEDDGKWYTLAEFLDKKSIEIAVDSDNCALTFGDIPKDENSGDNWIRDAFEAGRKIYVTVGMRGQLQETVSFRKDTPDWARDQMRTFCKQRPHLQRRVIPSGTIVGVSQTGVLQSPSSDVVIQDDLGQARSIMATSTPWCINPAWAVSFSRIGEIDKNYAKPGQMLIDIPNFEGSISAVLGIVTSVEFNFAEPGETMVTTKHIPVDVEQIG
jgi:hypothetical protein